jgi:glycosyltransferase involved in cell wall biosynthesis
MIAPEPWFQPRGTPFSVLHRIKALTTLGHQVDLVTYPFGRDIPMEGLKIFRCARVPFVSRVKIGPSAGKAIQDIPLFVAACLLLMRQHYHLVHTHEEAGFFGTFVTKMMGLPHLYDMHSSLPQQLKNFNYTDSKILRVLFEFLENMTIKNAAGVITICPELSRYVRHLYPHKNSVLIENVADNSMVFDMEKIDAAHLRQQYQLKDDKVILYYGTLEPYQGIDLLIQSAEILSQQHQSGIQFLLVGGNEHQVTHYRQAVERKGLKNFNITGFVQPGLIPALVSMADVLVSPRLEGNNSPLKIYSYLRSGKPIVATRHITHTQILNDQVAVLAEPVPEAFAGALTRVLRNTPKVKKMVRAARALAEKHYSYEMYLQKTDWIIQQAAASGYEETIPKSL